MILRKTLLIAVLTSALSACSLSPELHDSNLPLYEVKQMKHNNKVTQALTGSINKQGNIYLPQSENVAINAANYAAFESCTDFTNPISNISQICSKTIYSSSGKMVVNAPKSAQNGDLLLLFLSRTDNPLPHSLDGWNVGASCLKSKNSQHACYTVSSCETLQNGYCTDTYDGGGKKGEDLATVVFYKTKRQHETEFAFDLQGKNPAWAIVLSVTGADNNKPLGEIATQSSDSNKHSVFASVMADAGDITLLSMAFDDTADINDFIAPIGFDTIAWVAGIDEAGSVYAQMAGENSEPSAFSTRGKGGSRNKDALISIVIKAANDG